ncbi:phage minor head protein [Shinella sp.]|uniref:phage minor head protein n=1 Tax=Shinella sp. TaxID=1870904 RepID=UPI0028A59833|nr:phage minor head protein [Shinella sp.]
MRAAARQQIVAGLEQNRTPDQIARSLIGLKNRVTGKREGGVIGLNSRQVELMLNTEAKLLSGDPALMREYLTLKTRDRRFDSAVRKAIETGRPVNADDLGKIMRQLRDRNVQLRAKTIARNESITAMRAGRHEGFVQMLETGRVSEDQIERRWDATGDDHTRLSHLALHGQKVTGLSAPFVSPVTGARMMFPGDASLGAPAEELIQCRCFEHIRIRYIR